MSNIELFVEFFFEILNEKCEPIIALFEALKAYLGLREYHSLIEKENINVFININAYKEYKLLQEIKENHVQLVRSKK